jgi:hypothetical protein
VTFAQQVQLFVRPLPRHAVVYGHQRRQPPFLDERHTDGGGDPDILERRRLFGRQFLQIVVDDERQAGAEFLDGQRSEIGEAVMADDAGRSRRRPIATDGEPVFILVHVGIGADGYLQVLGQQSRGRRHDLVCLRQRLRRFGKPVQKSKPRLAFSASGLRAPGFELRHGLRGKRLQSPRLPLGHTARTRLDVEDAHRAERQPFRRFQQGAGIEAEPPRSLYQRIALEARGRRQGPAPRTPRAAGWRGCRWKRRGEVRARRCRSPP